MNKVIFASFALCSTVALAESLPKNTPVEQNQPIAALRVFDVSGKQPKLMSGNKLSRTKPRELCIILANLPVKEQNLFAEYFQAPAPMSISLEGANIQVEENRKNFLISFNVPKEDVSNTMFSQCWKFNKENPIGEYKLDLQFNDVVFKNLKFNILK